MTVRMAGAAGTILGAYAAMIGAQLLPYLLAARFLSAPGGVLMAKLMMPDVIVPPEPADVSLPETRISAEGPAALLPEGGLPPPDDLAEATHDEERPANVI